MGDRVHELAAVAARERDPENHRLILSSCGACGSEGLDEKIDGFKEMIGRVQAAFHRPWRYRAIGQCGGDGSKVDLFRFLGSKV